MSTSSPDVAILVYQAAKKRSEDESFDGLGNFGVEVIADVLRRAGVEVGYCSPESAREHQVVLVSMTSTYDMLALTQAVGRLPTWKAGRRPFRVVAGGAGMQNPTVVRHLVDYAAFGRSESFAVALVQAALDRQPFAHPSVMNLPEITPVILGQSDLYPHAINGRFEGFMGCKRKCKFCHYSWARKYKGPAGDYVQTSVSASSPEITWDRLRGIDRKHGRIRTAIDGFSARLRRCYGKNITGHDVVEGIEKIGSFGGTSTVLAYNISNMPTESDSDKAELYATLAQAQPSGRVIVVLQSTPFRPSSLTPMQWEPVRLTPTMSDLSAQVIVDRPNLRAMHSFSNEGPWSHLVTVVAERAAPATDKLWEAICFAPKLQSNPAADKVRRASAHFDLSPYLREYDIDEPHPADFLNSFTPKSKLRAIARKMREEARADG
jgi:hypothetical protein